MARMASAADQEEARLQALKSYAILDTGPEHDFDQVVRLAARVLNVPIAAIALVDRERHWFKASFGLDGARERPRGGCFCDHLVQQAGMFVVPDATDDPRFAEHPMVTGMPAIRFYAGAPIVNQDGYILGSLCVMDIRPHPGTGEQDVAILSDLVGFVRDKLELRRESRRGRALAEQAELVTRLMAAAAEAPDFAGAMFAAAEAIQDKTGALFCHVWRLAMDGTSAVWVGGAGRGAFQEAAYLNQLRALHLTAANSPVALALVEDEQNWNDNTATAKTSLLPAAQLALRSGVKLQLATPFRLGQDRYVFSLGLPTEPVEREATARMMREATIALRPMLRRHMDEAEGRLFQRLIEISSAGILVSEPPFEEPGPRIIYANPSIQSMTGYSLEEFRGRSPRLLFGPATDPDARRRIGKAIMAGLSVSEDVESYRKDGSQFWTALRVTPVPDSQGVVTHFISSHTDITSARDARLEREALTSDLQALVAAIPGVLMRHGLRDDGRWTRTFIAPGVEALTGFTVEEAMGSDWWAENTDPADRPRLLAALRTALGGSQTRVDFSFRRKDGVPIWIRILLRGHVTADGRNEAIGIWSDVTEEYQLAALREARTRELETVIATLPGVLIRGRQKPDGAWYATQVSPNVTSMTGYSVEEALRQGWWTANAARDPSERAGPGSADWARALPTEGEFEFRHKLGHFIWIRCRSRTYQDENGEPQLVSLWDDITVEKQLLLEREHLANDLQRLIATMPNVLIRAHRDDQRRWVRDFISPSIEALTGFTPEEARERGWWADQVDPADYERLLALQATGISHATDFRLRHKQGNLIWIHRSVTTHLDSHGREEAISIWSDVTAEKRLLMDREELARDLQAVIEAMPGVVIRKRKNADGAWHTVYVAPGIESVTGYSVAETLDPGWLAQHLDDDDRESLIRQMRGDFTQNQPSMEFRLRHRRGHSIWIRRLARGHVTAQGIPEIISIWIDVSHEKGLAEQLAHSAKLAQLGELATGMAHELNQPLAAISLAAENAQRSLTRMEDVPDRARDKLELIVALARRASDIIDHMRIFGRIETGGRSQVFLPEVLHGVESLLGNKLQTEGVRLVMKLPAELPPVLGKAVPLEQVMINLISNACDGYSGKTPPVAMEQRVIEVSAQTEGEWITIEVQDAAGGIPDELLPRIFEPFFTTKPVGKGTGLGLSISYGIISDMAGRITAENRHGGCLIRILLPPAPAI